MMNGGQIPCNVTAFCEMFKTSYRTGKTPYKLRFGEPFSGPVILLASMDEHHPISAKKTSQDFTSLVKSLSGHLHGVCVVWEGHLEKRYLGRGHGGAGKFGRVKIHARRLITKVVLVPKKR